jgi:hypothetical protein
MSSPANAPGPTGPLGLVLPAFVWSSGLSGPTGPTGPYSAPPTVPETWTATALLHPFGPPPTSRETHHHHGRHDHHNRKDPDTGIGTSPFYELCVGSFVFAEGALSAQIVGTVSGGTWWYLVTPDGTFASTDMSYPEVPVDMGWSVPTQQWLGAGVGSAGISPLNWMDPNANVAWWKMPAVLGQPTATWIWFTAPSDGTGPLPFRLMFGGPPPTPTTGCPDQLAIFQNFSFTYFASFTEGGVIPTEWVSPQIPGFTPGNPYGWRIFEFNRNFGTTTFMTPCNENYNPLPTSMLYVYKRDDQYRVLTDRAQSTVMNYTYNPGPTASEQALLYGSAPKGITAPPNAGIGFINDVTTTGQSCGAPKVDGFYLGQEPPNWATPSVGGGQICGVIENNAALAPGNSVMIVLEPFPPVLPNYPTSTDLWTWYALQPGASGPTGLHCRPVTFMQSASTIDQGTSLALADYFDYREFKAPIDPSFFALPPSCSGATATPQSFAEATAGVVRHGPAGNAELGNIRRR